MAGESLSLCLNPKHRLTIFRLYASASLYCSVVNLNPKAIWFGFCGCLRQMPPLSVWLPSRSICWRARLVRIGRVSHGRYGHITPTCFAEHGFGILHLVLRKNGGSQLFHKHSSV